MEQLGADDMGGIVVKTPLPPGVFRSLWKVHLSLKRTNCWVES
jgi:hypothetical protein